MREYVLDSGTVYFSTSLELCPTGIPKIWIFNPTKYNNLLKKHSNHLACHILFQNNSHCFEESLVISFKDQSNECSELQNSRSRA